MYFLQAKTTADKWDRPQIVKLIDLFEEEPSLYDTRNELYHNKHARTENLERIALKLADVRPGTTPAQVKTKWNSLRSHFNAELAQTTRSKKSGEGTDNIHIPTVWWFCHMEFLRAFSTPRKSQSTFRPKSSTSFKIVS